MINVKNENMEMCKLLINNGASASINTPDKVNIFVYMYMIRVYHICILKSYKCILCIMCNSILYYCNYIMFIHICFDNCILCLLGWKYTSYDKHSTWKCGDV
jgi:hypothetical protein